MEEVEDSLARVEGLARMKPATTQHRSLEQNGVFISRCLAAILCHLSDLTPYLQELASWWSRSSH